MKNQGDVNKVLCEYYRVGSEQCIHLGKQMIKVLTACIMCMAVSLTFTGLLITQNINLSSNLIGIGIVVIAIILFLFFLSFFLYYLFLRITRNSILNIGRKIEELQRDILFDKINQEELQERFEEVFPILNSGTHEIKWENLFYPPKDSK